MWRSPTTPKRATPSPSASASASPEACSPDQSPQPSFRRRPLSASGTTLTQALRGDPFQSNRVRPVTPPHDDPTTSLNKDLRTLAHVYPDVKIDVLRELLSRFDGESRLHICTEQLVKYKSKWARGRLLNPPRDAESKIPIEELFRSESYIDTTKRILATEFKSLNKSAIDAVLAEVNNSYSHARPVLQGIAAKSWRATISSFFKKRKGSDEPPPFLIGRSRGEIKLQNTGNHNLDEELDKLFFANIRQQLKQTQEQRDTELAIALNQTEAEEAQALFECQVCYNDLPFEFIVTCTGSAHTICHDCVKRSLNEAVFGQGWAQSVDVNYGSMRCVASDNSEICDGHIPPSLLQIVILSAKSGRETWNKFEQRLAVDSLIKSGLALVQCPFCHYAETPQVYTPSFAESIQWRFRKQEISFSLILLVLLSELVLPTIILVLLIITLWSPGLPHKLFTTSLININRLAQTQRFRCKNPGCARTSCLSCSKPWHDPHTCHEPLIISLRTAVEAARTAALKRTCPRCGTSFIKSSGCNKLTCVCGYAMCYLCRKNIGKVNDGGAVDDREGGEGYRHFCEHFRPLPGQKCTECNKCDLYMNEDEEIAVRKAGEEAEQEWREKEGMVGVKGLGLEEAVVSLGRLGRDDSLKEIWHKFVIGDWTVQGACDWVVGKLIVVES